MGDDLFENENPLDYNNDKDWLKYKIWVIDNIRSLRNDVKKLQNDITDTVMKELNTLENKITALQVKASVWGLASGLIAVLISILVKSYFG